MNTDPTELIERLRAHRMANLLPARTAQILRDAEAALARCGQGLLADQDDLDPPTQPPGEATATAVIAAALEHWDHTGNTAFVLPVPYTAPELIVAMGEPGQIMQLLASRAALADR
jgi:hypothetical protein